MNNLAPVSSANADVVDFYAQNVCSRFEGLDLFLYQDIDGFMTIGDGNMVPNVGAAQKLPLRLASGDLATPAQIAADFARVEVLPKGRLAGFYHCASSLVLSPADNVALLATRCTAFIAQLQHEFASFDSFPALVKLALLDMIYNLGLGGLRKYVHFYAAVRAGNWSAAANACIRDASNAAFAPRNAWTQACFRESVPQPGVIPSLSAAADFERDAFDDYMDALAEEHDGSWFHGRVAGVTHPNDDGSCRQRAIADLNERDELELDPEPDNPFDRSAVRVLTRNGSQIGYLEKRLAGDICRRLARGAKVRCYARKLTGRESQTRGVVIALLQHS